MKKNNLGAAFSLAIMIILPIELCLAFAIWVRTDIASYDVKYAHCHMDTKYCPYCGELLKEDEEDNGR